MKKQKQTMEAFIASITSQITAKTATPYHFQTLAGELGEQFGELCKSQTTEDRDSKGRVTSLEEIRSWRVGRYDRLYLEYCSQRGIFIYVGDDDGDAEDDGSVLFHLPAKLPKKTTRQKKEEKGLMTPKQFEVLVYQQLSVNERSVVKDDQVEFMAHVLDHMLGAPDGQNSDSSGSGTREWYVGNAQLVLAWSKKGMTLKMNDDGAPLI